MASRTRLQGTDLIDCAKANAPQGIGVAAELCGYGDDLNAFQQELTQACDRIGVKINELKDLVTDQHTARQIGGIEVAPDTASEL